MAKQVDCECGVTVRGETDDELVRNVQDHATSVHDMDLSREQALSMAHPA